METPQQSSQDSLESFKSDEKKSLVKLGIPTKHKCDTWENFFDLTIEQKKMEKVRYAKEEQDKYFRYLEENRGDVHYYKVQYFSYRYEREVKNIIIYYLLMFYHFYNNTNNREKMVS